MRVRAGTILLAAALTFGCAEAGFATPTKIRAGGPSSPSEPKVAIVGSDKSLKGDGFEVLDV